MTDTNAAFSQRDENTPSPFTKFLWWLSTGEKELLSGAVVDGNRYRIIGMTVLATWSFATLAWFYFFTTVASSVFIAALMGLFMGFIILTIDRALIKGINKFNKNKFLPLLLRAVLATTIGVFMAQPALLFMFRKEIAMQVSLDNEGRKIIKRTELDSLYKNRKAELLGEKDKLQKETTAKYEDVNKARQNFLAEADGSGGTGKVGIKDIALAKKVEYEKLDKDYQQLLLSNQPAIAAIDKELNEMESNIKKEEQAFTQYLNDGFLTQIEALNNLIKTNTALQFRYYLLVVILLLIELMPVIAKTLLPSGTYDERAFLREAMEKEMANSSISKEQKLKELYNEQAFLHDSEAITAFFTLSKDDRTEKIKSFSKKWKEENHQAFDGLWQKMKREILTKQEG
jgi:phosphate/sulfate permease